MSASASVRQRRAFLRAGAALAAGVAWPAVGWAAHVPVGPVSPPVPAPSLWLVRDDGSRVELRQHLLGKVTVAQLMFTSCTATCPLQGALFSAVAKKVAAPDVQLLSISVDPEGDTPEKLAAWLGRYGAPRSWRAGTPKAGAVDALFDFFRGREAGVDRHSAQAFVIDRKARLAFRSQALPAVRDVVDAVGQVARGG